MATIKTLGARIEQEHAQVSRLSLSSSLASSADLISLLVSQHLRENHRIQSQATSYSANQNGSSSNGAVPEVSFESLVNGTSRSQAPAQAPNGGIAIASDPWGDDPWDSVPVAVSELSPLSSGGAVADLDASFTFLVRPRLPSRPSPLLHLNRSTRRRLQSSPHQFLLLRSLGTPQPRRTQLERPSELVPSPPRPSTRRRSQLHHHHLLSPPSNLSLQPPLINPFSQRPSQLSTLSPPPSRPPHLSPNKPSPRGQTTMSPSHL